MIVSLENDCHLFDRSETLNSIARLVSEIENYHFFENICDVVSHEKPRNNEEVRFLYEQGQISLLSKWYDNPFSVWKAIRGAATAYPDVQIREAVRELTDLETSQKSRLSQIVPEKQPTSLSESCYHSTNSLTREAPYQQSISTPLCHQHDCSSFNSYFCGISECKTKSHGLLENLLSVHLALHVLPSSERRILERSRERLLAGGCLTLQDQKEIQEIEGNSLRFVDFLNQCQQLRRENHSCPLQRSKINDRPSSLRTSMCRSSSQRNSPDISERPLAKRALGKGIFPPLSVGKGSNLYSLRGSSKIKEKSPSFLFHPPRFSFSSFQPKTGLYKGKSNSTLPPGKNLPKSPCKCEP